MNKKYELLTNDTITFVGKTLYRIKALKDFGNVKAGNIGGYVKGYHNLSHNGDCWIYDDAMVYDYASISEDAEVFGNAKVYDDASIRGNATICDNARIHDRATICDNARIYSNANIYDSSKISNNADILSNNDYLFIRGLGSENRSTTAFKLSDGGVYVNCGCFEGTLDEFESKVQETHGDNKYGKDYKMLIDMCKLHFGLM